MMYTLRRLFSPEIFQGAHKRRNYFEGWYFKLIDRQAKRSLAVIPGMAADKKSHAFVQVLDGVKNKTAYVRYDISHFRYSKKVFEISIGNNSFDKNSIVLDIDDPDIRIKGKLEFENVIPYPGTLTRPGIMGPYGFVPFMECYHGIVNIHHDILGSLEVDGEVVDFTGGYGYIEKDWGRSFPVAWIWLQSNHFDQEDVSVMFSVARIPWFGRHFQGFISFLRIGDKILHFGTYTGARISTLEYSGGKLLAVLKDRHHTFEIRADNSEAGVLKAPKNGMMKREISESISAKVKVRLLDQKGVEIFSGTGENTGFEAVDEAILLQNTGGTT
jgi:tocopherol cyclase